MTSKERIAEDPRTAFPTKGDVVELSLLLPSHQLFALEVVAVRLKLTVGQLLRRAVSEFLRKTHPLITAPTNGVREGA